MLLLIFQSYENHPKSHQHWTEYGHRSRRLYPAPYAREQHHNPVCAFYRVLSLQSAQIHLYALVLSLLMCSRSFAAEEHRDEFG